MRCKSNTIGAWLDENYLNSTTDFYRGAIAVLEVAGFKIDCVPCGCGIIHVVNPPDRIVKADGREVAVDGLFWQKEA